MDGNSSNAAFKKLLQQFAQILRDEGYCTVDEEVLEKVMKEMDLCFTILQGSGYFAPALFVEEMHKRLSLGLHQRPSWRCVAEKLNMSGDISFVCVRVQCWDRTRTALTPVFFPTFQVYYSNHLISSGRTDQIVWDYNMIYIIFEEYEFYVESDGNLGDHIDVMVRSPNFHFETFKFIHQNMVKEIQDFCASPKGCLGVALVLGVLSSGWIYNFKFLTQSIDCIRNLTLSSCLGVALVLGVEFWMDLQRQISNTV